jgi:hypothetical protein
MVGRVTLLIVVVTSLVMLTGCISGGEIGSLMVNSTPEDATVYIDGEKIEGTTPVLIEGLKAGKHVLRVSKPGYKDKQRKNIRIRPRKTRDIHLELRRSRKGG